MSGLLGSAKSQVSQAPDYVGLQTQTSVSTLPIAWVRGRAMLAPNIIDYTDFTKTPVNNGSSQGKGGGGGSSTSYDYSAAIIMALCEGPVQGIGKVWKGQSQYTLADLGLTLFNGDWNQAPWGWMASKHPERALAYPGLTYLAASNYPLGQSASLDNHNIEVIAALAGTGANGIDADPAQTVLDFLTHPQDGIGFPSAYVDQTTLLGVSGDSSYQTYCRAMGLCFSPCITSVESGISIFQRWMQLTNTGVVWSDGKLKFIPYGDEQVIANGVTFNPAVQIRYDLDETDFHVEEGEDAVTISRADPSDAFTIERLQIKDRANNYVDTPIEARDPAGVQRFGDRTDTGISASEICDPAVAQIVGQLIVQRGLYVRKFFQFKLSWEYCRLEPMDCVTLTVAAQHLNRVPVRITKVDADDKKILTFTAEALPAGVATAAQYPKQGINPYTLDRNVKAAPVNTPVIFEPSAELSKGAQMWIGVSGGTGGHVDPNWGGADVYVSADNVEYGKVARITAPACQGFLLADLPAYAGEGADQVHQLLVDLAESGGELVNASEADAAAGRTLCWVDGEIIAYATATVTAPNEYTLTYLERGLYGTTPSLHRAGAQFLRLNTAVLQYDLPKQYVGAPLWLKFVSFNIFDAGWGDLADAVAYTVTPTGEGYFVAPPTNLAASQAVVASSLGMRVDVTVTWTKSVTSWVTDYEVSYRMGTGAWTTFTTAGEPLAVIQNVLDASYDIKVCAIGLGLSSAPAEIVWNVTTDSLDLPPVTGLELTGQANDTQFVGKDAHFTWRLSSSYGSSEALSSSSSAGSNFMDSWFKSFRVTIYDLANNALRTETVTDPTYTYSFEKNASDAGGPHRSFRIEVVWTDNLNRVSAPASITVSNPAPGYPTKILPLSAFKTVSVQFVPPGDLDYAGTMVFMSTESFGGAVPPESALVYDGTDTLINRPAVAGTQYFLVLASYDSFGKDGLNYSSEYTTTTAYVGTTDIADSAVTTIKLDQDLNSAIQLVTSGPETPGSLAAALASILALGNDYTAIQSAVTTLTTTVNGNTAAITTEATTRAGADAANASAITALSAYVNGNFATITQLNTAVSSAEQAASQQVNTLSASLPNTYATFTTVNQAIAGINSASSTFLQQLNSTVSGHSASIQTQATTLNGLSAQYTVKVDNNGYVSGFGLASSPVNGQPFSSFIVNVNEFGVAAPGATAFALQVINGQVCIPNAAIQNAAITNAKIANLAVDNSNIALGAATVAGSVNIGALAGNGSYENAATCTITLKSTATVVIMASWGCNYDSGFGNTNQQFFGQIYGGSAPIGPVLHTGVATTQTPSYMWSTTLAPGTYQAVFWWQGDNSHVQILAGSMTVLAMQK